MDSDEQEIRQLVATWIEATRTGDLDTILALMTDDVIFLLPDQRIMQGKQAFADASPPTAVRQQMSFEGVSEIQEIQVSGTLAYLWSRLRVKVVPQPGAPPIERAGFTLTILRQENGKWLLARDANLLSPVTQPEQSGVAHPA